MKRREFITLLGSAAAAWPLAACAQQLKFRCLVVLLSTTLFVLTAIAPAVAQQLDGPCWEPKTLDNVLTHFYGDFKPLAPPVKDIREETTGTRGRIDCSLLFGNESVRTHYRLIPLAQGGYQVTFSSSEPAWLTPFIAGVGILVILLGVILSRLGMAILAGAIAGASVGVLEILTPEFQGARPVDLGAQIFGRIFAFTIFALAAYGLKRIFKRMFRPRRAALSQSGVEVAIRSPSDH